MSINNVLKNQQETTDNFVSPQSQRQILKRGSERIKVIEGPSIDQNRDVSSDTLWGTNTWSGGTWDNTYTNASVTTSVTNPNNSYKDLLTTTQFKDTVNTTATWTGNGEITFTAGQVAQSSEVYKDTNMVSKATLIVETDSTTATYQMRTDDAVAWETVSNNVQHTFTNKNPELYFKITDSATATITKININYE